MNEPHECKNCENFDLSTNMCLQHNEIGYDCAEHCLHIGCKDWIQCSGFVPDMQAMIHQATAGLDKITVPTFIFDTFKKYAELYCKIEDIVNNTDSQWDCDVKSAYMEIEKIVKGNTDHE